MISGAFSRKRDDRIGQMHSSATLLGTIKVLGSLGRITDFEACWTGSSAGVLAQNPMTCG